MLGEKIFSLNSFLRKLILFFPHLSLQDWRVFFAKKVFKTRTEGQTQTFSKMRISILFVNYFVWGNPIKFYLLMLRTRKLLHFKIFPSFQAIKCFSSNKSYYETLGIPISADKELITQKYQQLCILYFFDSSIFILYV